MNTTPISPVPLDPDQNPDEATPVVRTPPGDDSPMTAPAANPEQAPDDDPDQDPDEQLPRDS